MTRTWPPPMAQRHSSCRRCVPRLAGSMTFNRLPELAAVDTALDANEPMRAFQALRGFIDYPGQMRDDDDWREVFARFGRISEGLGDTALAERFTPEALSSPQALFDIGY